MLINVMMFIMLSLCFHSLTGKSIADKISSVHVASRFFIVSSLLMLDGLILKIFLATMFIYCITVLAFVVLHLRENFRFQISYFLLFVLFMFAPISYSLDCRISG